MKIDSRLVIVPILIASVALFQNCSQTMNSSNFASETAYSTPPIDVPVDPGSPAPPTNPLPVDPRGNLQKFTDEYPASWLQMYATFTFKTVAQINDASFANNSFLPPPNANTGKKRMLIIGDSISLCYTPYVRQILADRFEVHRVPHNGASTELGMSSIDKYLEAGPWDVISVNWGLHDLTYFPDKPQQHKTLIAEYDRRLREILFPKLKSSGAKLIWMRTTQSNNHPVHRPIDIDEYNVASDAATKVFSIPTLDLLDGVANVQYQTDNLHFMPATCGEFAKKINQRVREISP